MYQATESYLNATLQLTRQTSSKIIIDGVEYIDELISHPLVSIENSSLIGGFPAKKITFDMYRVDGLSIAGKEITVYRGMYIDDENIEYIPQGIFTAKSEDITINEFGNRVSVVAYDRAILFDVQQQAQPKLTDTFTYGDYINFILSDMDVNISSADYLLKNTVMLTLPNIAEGTTKRELLSKFAEIIGAICIIDRNGDLSFVRQQDSNLVFSDNYNRFVLSEDVSVINQLCVSTQDINDDTVFPDIKENAVQYRLISNPFCSSNQKEIIKLIAPNIIGLTTARFTLSDAIDDYIVDINDIITVHTSKGNEYKLPVLSYTSTGRIKADIGADVVTDNNNTGLENSLSARVKNAEIQIDKQNGIISLKVSEDDLCSLIEQNASNIKFKANKLIFESENFAVDENGNARLTGEINALNGLIGGLTIGTWKDSSGKTHEGLKKTFSINGSYVTFAIDGTSGSSTSNYLLQMFYSDKDGNAAAGEYLFALSSASVMELDTLDVRKINFKNDTGWSSISYSNNFQAYSSSDTIRYRRVGDMVEIRGACKPNKAITSSVTEYTIGNIGKANAPSSRVRVLCQGSGIAEWFLVVNTNGDLTFSRYRQGSSYVNVSDSTFLCVQASYFIG